MSLQSPNKYETNLDSLYQQFDLALDEIVKTYTNYKVGVNDDYLHDRDNFNSIKGKIMNLQQNLNNDMTTVSDELFDLNTKLEELDNENNSLTNKANTLGNQELAAEGELSSQKFMANEIFAQNIVLLLLIILNISVYLVKTYKPQL